MLRCAPLNLHVYIVQGEHPTRLSRHYSLARAVQDQNQRMFEEHSVGQFLVDCNKTWRGYEEMFVLHSVITAVWYIFRLESVENHFITYVR